MKRKKIDFFPVMEHVSVLSDPPTPAINHLPEWYKKTSTKVYPDQKNTVLPKREGVNRTIKSCMPVFDAMTAGYYITTPCDVEFVDPNEYGGDRIVWMADWPFITTHGMPQLGHFPIPEEYENIAFKWENSWEIDTPSGYSLLVVHPLYRNDLPFYTLPGIIDTDTFKNHFNLPFLVRKDFYGILKKGTPIAQVIPIKRDNWKSEVQEFDPRKKFNDMKKMIVIKNSYKTRWWNKKDYE
jgi:hypothetical protein